ncbi:MAG: D-alanyl-D-alanine carboxypeptidase/D-alanyl-D-alanine-endopeptidase [Betaproteobacteria bacterium]|nr:D-alanyl-D-alanine carboxypeptidase/D-alanyl-D-alanine-endopeptidase [Betaproteobacteria bacterium]
MPNALSPRTLPSFFGAWRHCRTYLFALCSLSLASAPLPAGAAPLPPTVAQALAASGIPASQVSIAVQAVDASRPLLAHNPAQAMNSASVMKLLTTYAALEMLGPAYTWKTDVLAEAPPLDGRLAGNLYLKGGGDPALTLERFWLLLRQLRSRGLKDIGGDLVLDRSAYALPPYDPAAFDNEPLRAYNAGPDPLLVNLKALRLTLNPAPDGSAVRVIQETPLDNLKLSARVTAATGDCGDWREMLAIRYDAPRASLEIGGRFPTACGDKPLYLTPLDADTYLDDLFRPLWREMGGSLGGRVRPGDAPASAQLLARWESPPLAEVIREVNKYSNNVMARQIFLALGNSDAPASPERAQARLRSWLDGKHLSMPELVLENGSGLSRRERISAGSLLKLLLAAWTSPVMPEFVASLPLAGSDGTLKRRFGNSPAMGRAHLKTGSLEGARAWAGYVTDQGGRRWAVVMLANGPKAGAAWSAMDALLAWVMNQPGQE